LKSILPATLFAALCALAQETPSKKIVSGVCQVTLDNVQINSKTCDLNIGREGYLPADATLRIEQISASCTTPIDRALRTIRLDTQLSSAYEDSHSTFVRVTPREVRTPVAQGEYTGSQRASVYAGPNTKIVAVVTAERGNPFPPIFCEVRFQGMLVP